MIEPQNPRPESIGFQLAFAFLSINWLLFGYYVSWNGGVTKGFKYAGRTIFIGDAAGVFIACVFIALALVAALVGLQNRQNPRVPAWVQVLVAAVMVLPAIGLQLQPLPF